MKIIILAVIISLLFAASSSGQNPKIDSLETVLKKHIQADTAKVNLLNRLAYEIRLHEPQRTRQYVKESLDLSLKLNYPKGKAVSLWITGITIMYKDREAALDYFNQALQIAEEIDDKEGQCNYCIAIGNTMNLLGNTKSSNDAFEKALLIARNLDNKRLLVKVEVNSAMNKTRLGDHDGAIKQLQEVVEITKEIDYNEVLARAYAKLGLIYRMQGNFPTSLEYYLSSLAINEERNDYVGVYDNYINIADIQSDQNDFNEALKTINKALKLAMAKQDLMRISTCFNFLGNIYQRTDNPEALYYFRKSLSMSKYNKMPQNIDNLLNIGSIYTNSGEFQKAMESFNEALILAQKANVKRIFADVYVRIGVLFLKQEKYDQAEVHIQKALTFAKETHSTELQKDCHKLLSDVYAATSSFRKAYECHVQYKSLYDSIYNEKNTRQIAFLESSYKFAKEREVYELEKTSRELRIKSQQLTILSLVVISLLVLALSSAIYWSAKMRKRVLRLEIDSINQELEANQKAMAMAQLKLVQNSERDAHNVKRLEDIGRNTIGEEHKNLSSLINNYKLQTHHSNWAEFETLFTKVNTSFWDKLNELYPTLTPNERKLCVFLKLNMSNKDIALITFQSEEALKKSRLRLRKKFDLDRSTNLIAFIQNL